MKNILAKAITTITTITTITVLAAPARQLIPWTASQSTEVMDVCMDTPMPKEIGARYRYCACMTASLELLATHSEFREYPEYYFNFFALSPAEGVCTALQNLDPMED